MIEISIQIEGQNGLNWPRWKRIVAEVESLGFAGLFRSDHFTNARPPDLDSLEMLVSLAYLADHTERVRFGPLVAPLSFRDPRLLVRQAAALDDLSGGRLVLGVGAGWQEREHGVFGYDLGDIPTRMARFEEGLAILTQLLRGAEPVTRAGRFFAVREAVLLPRPRRPGGPRILIGGNGPARTLPLVARYADVWNAVALTPETFRERSARLDELLRAVGRAPGEVKRTMMTMPFVGRDAAELERRVARVRAGAAELAALPLDALLDYLRTERGALAGTPDDLRRQLAEYEAAGLQEIMLQWLDLDDSDGLRALAETALPRP